MTEHEWTEKYRPIPNPQDGGFFWYERDIREAKVGADKVWTVIDGEEESLWATPGRRYVNRVAYVVTEVAWNADETDVCLDR